MIFGPFRSERPFFDSIAMPLKDIIHTVAACWMLLFGCLLCLISLYLPPRGIIDASVLWVLGQAIIFAASVFGAKSYIDYQIDKMRHDDTET